MNPSYLNTLPPIVALSVGVAVTSSLQTNAVERLTWLEAVLQTVNLRVSKHRSPQSTLFNANFY